MCNICAHNSSRCMLSLREPTCSNMGSRPQRLNTNTCSTFPQFPAPIPQGGELCLVTRNQVLRDRHPQDVPSAPAPARTRSRPFPGADPQPPCIITKVILQGGVPCWHKVKPAHRVRERTVWTGGKRGGMGQGGVRGHRVCARRAFAGPASVRAVARASSGARLP